MYVNVCECVCALLSVGVMLRGLDVSMFHSHDSLSLSFP